MEKIKLIRDGVEYSSSRGRCFKYFFNNGEQGFLQMGETDDYFYFTIMLKEGYLKDNYTLDINENSFIYEALNKLLKGYKYIEVMEEETPEKKSIGFKKQKDNIQILFNLTADEKAFWTIELANLRRLGDTRFAKFVPTDKYNETEFYEMESSFRYKFKARIHQMLDDLEDKYTEHNEIQIVKY